MNISPISFGKAVRVNGSTSEAFDIARLANEKKASKGERSAQKEAKAIFDDTDIAPAQVATYITPYNTQEVYVVSGVESKKFDKLNDQIALGLIQAGNALNDVDKFNVSSRRQMNNHNQRVRSLLANSPTNYDIQVSYDEQGTRVKSINRRYDDVYAVAGTTEQIADLRKILAKTKGYVTCFEATDLYQGSSSSGLCAQAANQGKEIAFVVTGKNANRKHQFMDFGWSSINGISRRLQKFIALDNVKEDAKQIQEAMEYDYKKEEN